MNIELSDQEVTTIKAGLLELQAKYSFDLIVRFVALEAAAKAEASKVPGPDLKMVSAG